MKSTDTILGAFAVLGFALLAFFAFAGSTNDTVINTDEINLENEEVLTPDQSDEDVLSESETQAETLANELAANNLVDELDPQTLRNSVQDFLEGNNTELQQQVLGSTNLGVETQVSADDEATTEELEESEVTEEEVELKADEPGKIRQFFGGLFSGDDNEESVAENVGGSNEDVIVDEEVLVMEGSYVVKAGDNLWDILKAQGMSNADTANYINGVRGDSSAMNDAGITSGNVDLIFPGQVLNL